MKLLMENWRKYLEEAAVADEGGLGIFVEEHFPDIGHRSRGHFGLGEGLIMTLIDTDELQMLTTDDLYAEDILNIYKNAVKGYIEIGNQPEIKHGSNTPCYSEVEKQTWTVERAAARSGYGPLLYDMALLASKPHSPGLIADRDEVSDSASGIYGQWLRRGSGATGIKIEARKLDNIEDPQTPPKEDDCQVHQHRDPAVNFIFSTPSSDEPFRVLRKRADDMINGVVGDNPYGIKKQELVIGISKEGGALFDALY